MAKSFNLTAQINLQGPTNLKPVVNNLKKQLSGISTNVTLNIDPKNTKTIGNITQKLQSMNAALIQAKTSTDSLNTSLSSLGNSLNSVSRVGGSTANAVNKTAASAQNATKAIKQAGTEMQEFGKQAALAVRRFAAFSIVTTGVYGLVNAVNSGVKAFINFDREIIKLQQITGKGVSGIASLEKEITKLATTLGVSSESLISVASTLAQAGLSAEETRVALAALAKTELAPSFDNITDTTEGAIAALRQFGLQASELEGVLGSINAVSKAFAVESKDIISAIQRTGGVFASASKGVSEGSDALNEFIAVFTSVRQTTRESAETIATGLRTIFTRIQRQSTVEALDELGIKLRDANGQFVGAYEAVRRLSEGLSRLDPRSKEFAAISEELGGFRQIGKVIPLIQQFSVAQEALKVAQKGQSSLTADQVAAQKSLANQIAKVREQFLALIRDVGKSSVFQGFFKIVVSLSSALISLAGAFKPILPLLGILGAVKGVSAIGQFATGFFGGLKKTGGAGAVGSNVAGAVTGSSSKTQQDALNQASSAIKNNTTAIQALTGAVNKLTPAISNNSTDIKANIDNVNTSVKNLNTALVNGINAIGRILQNRGGGTKGLNDGGQVLGFARGGVVPGSGNRDTVPAMLQPGEFVIRKKAVDTIGADRLHSMNKYAEGGSVEDQIQANMNASRISDRKNIKAFGLAGLYAGSAKADSFGVSGQKNIKLFAGTSKEEDAVLYTSSLNTSVKGQGIKEIEEDLQQSYIKAVDKFAKAIAEKIQGKTSNIKDVLDEQAFSVVSGNAFESAIRSIGAPFLEKTEKTKSLDFPLGLGSAANLFGNIPSNIPTDVTRTIGGKGKGEAAIVGQIERFLEAVQNKEFTKAQYGGLSSAKISAAIDNISAQALTAQQIRDKISQTKDTTKKSAVDKYLKLVGSRGTQTRSLKTIYEKQAKLQPDTLPAVEEGILALENIVLGRAAGGKANDTVPALLTPGEFVVNKKSAQKIGYARLNKLNQADKIKGYNKGGIVGGIQTFLGGGRVDQDVVRAQGTVLTNIKEAEKTFAMVMGSVSKDVRDSLLKTFKGIESVGAGGKTSLGTTFTENTRGQAVFGVKNNQNVSAMGLQIGGQKAKATTETVAHEAGHLVDATMANLKGFASSTKGTFQFDLIEKIKPTMEAAFRKAGEDSVRIEKYLTKNEELFAEFFAKASPEVRKILTSTTDAAKGMEELKKHLEKAGETYAGLSAADIVIPGGMPPIPPTPPPTVPPTPVPPGPGGPGRDRFNFANENDKAFFAYRAKQAGKSVGAFRTDAARKIATEQRNIIENQKGRREETKFAFQGRASETGKNLKALEAAKGASAADAKKYSDALKTAMREAAAELKEIAPNLSGSELRKASKELVRAMMNGESINDAISKSGSALEKAFNDNIDSSKALDMAIEQTAKQLNISADQLRGNLSRKDIAREQFIGSETGQKFGRAAQFAPDALRRFSQTGTGQATLKAADFLSGKGLTGKLEKSLGNAGKFIGDKIQALGGPMVVLGSTVAMAADQINKAFDGIKDPTTAGVVGGIGGAGSGLASGALLGAQIAGPVGAMIGGISGAIIGGIDGAFKAFNEARLAKNLKNLEKSAHDASIALKEFETNQTNESANALIEATMSGQDAIKDLAQTAQVQYGEPSWARAIVNGLSNLPVISSIMGTAQRGESVQALDQRAAMVLSNFSKVGDRELRRAPIQQVEDVITKAAQAAEAAGGIGTDAGREASRNVYAQANQTYQQMARKGYSDTDIFTAMGRQSLQQQGIDPATQTQEEVIKAGKEAAAVSAEAAFKQQQLANAMRETNRSVENLLDVFRVASAGLDRFNYELGLIATNAENNAAALQGNASFGAVDRTNEQVLGNISAYSMDEVKAVAANIGSLAGGPGGEKLQNQVVAAKVLQDELPKILRSAGGGDVGDVTAKLKDVFEGLSIEAPEGLFTNIAKSLEEKIGGRQGGSLSDLADDTDFLGSASKVSAEALALAAKYANAFNNAMQQATNQANQYAKSLDEATQWQLRAADIRARADIQLAETLGKTVSLADRAAPFENRMRGLSSGVVAGGSIDPNEIYDAMIDATKDRESMQAELANRQQTLAANPEDKNAQKAVADQTRLIAEQNNKINNANKALEELANDSSRAADALNKLNELNKVAAGSVNFLQKALTSDGKTLIDMNKKIQDYTKLISGNATSADVNNLGFRQNVFGGLEELSSMMPASLAQQMQAKVTRAMLESMPEGQQLLQQTTGAIGPDNKPVTFDAALRMMEGGIDPAQQQYIDAYKAATQAQADAADRLAAAAVLVATEFNNSLQKTIEKIGTLPETMRNAQNQANVPPGEPKPDDKDQTLRIVMEQAELDRIRDTIANAPTLGFDKATAGTLDTTLQELIKALALTTTAIWALVAAYTAFGKGKGIMGSGGLGRFFGGGSGGGAASGNPFSGMSGTMGNAAGGTGGTSRLGILGRFLGGAEVIRGGVVGATEATPTNKAVEDVAGVTAGTAINTLTGALTGNTGRAFVSDLLGFETNSVGDQLGGTLEAAGRGAAIGYQYGGGQGAILGTIAGLTGDMLKNIVLLVGEVGKLREAQRDAAAQAAKAARIEGNLKQAELQRSKAAGVDTKTYDRLNTNDQAKARARANTLLQRERLDEKLQQRGGEENLTREDLNYISGGNYQQSDSIVADRRNLLQEIRNDTGASETRNIPQKAINEIMARGRLEAKARQAEDAAAQAIEQQRPDIAAMGQMANEATQKGSIYTHDIHLESLVKNLLGQQPDNEKLNTTNEASTVSIGGFIQKLPGLVAEKSTNVLDLVNNLLPQQFKDLFNIFDKPEQNTNESCECKILKEILATLKGQSTPAQINKQAAVAATAAAEKTVMAKPTGIGTLDGGVASDKDKIVKGAVIQAPKAPGTEKSTNNSVASMLAGGGFGTMTLPKSADSPAKLKAILESKRNKYAAAGSKLSKNQITKEEYDKIKGEYRESRGLYGAATAQQNGTAYQQAQTSRRQGYLATKRPEVAEKLMTDAEKQQRAAQEKQRKDELEKQKNQPVPSALPTIKNTGSLDGGANADRGVVGSGPTGQLATVITVDKTATDLLEGLKSTFSNFNSYIDKLATVASTIPNEINLVGSYDLNINITGAAALENLSKEMQSVAESIIKPRLDQLRDEISQATKGAVKSSTAIGYKGDVNTTSAQGLA